MIKSNVESGVRCNSPSLNHNQDKIMPLKIGLWNRKYPTHAQVATHSTHFKEYFILSLILKSVAVCNLSKIKKNLFCYTHLFIITPPQA